MTPHPRTCNHPARLVLLVGPGLRIDAALSQTLAREGMRCLWLPGVQQALDAARLARFDAVVLDSVDVDGQGATSLAQLRPRLRCPIVVVAPHADEVDEILALELGADAFLVRPLAPRRLRAHLMALMRPAAQGLMAAPSSAEEPALPPSQWAGWALDTHGGSLSGRGRRVELTVVQSALMQCLVDAAGRVVSRSQLTAALPRGPKLAAHSVCVYVARLRKKLLDEGVHELRVESVRGRGFVLRTAPPGPRDMVSTAAPTVAPTAAPTAAPMMRAA